MHIMSRKFQITSLTKSSSKLIHISRDVLNIVNISSTESSLLFREQWKQFILWQP